MIGTGCALNFCLFWGLVCIGALMSEKHGHSFWAGAGWGVLAWLAAMCTYFVWLTIYDFIQRHKFPNREDVAIWVNTAGFLCFLAAVWLTILIGRRLFFWHN